jgi:hypothetical protein
MNRSIEVEAGQRFREAGVNAFGIPSCTVWVVGRTWRGRDGLDYVELAHSSDPGRKKTISTSALADRKLFIPDLGLIRERISQNAIGSRHRFFKAFARLLKSPI